MATSPRRPRSLLLIILLVRPLVVLDEVGMVVRTWPGRKLLRNEVVVEVKADPCLQDHRSIHVNR